MVDRLREGIYITDKNGLILDANPAFLEMLGIESLSELRGLTASDLLVDPDRRVFMTNADRQTTEQVVERVKESARLRAPVQFSLGWSVRQEREPLEQTVGRADKELITVRIESRRFALRDGDPE